MNYYKILQSVINRCYIPTVVLSLILSILGRYILSELEKEEYIKILRLGNVELHLIAFIAVLIIAGYSPVIVKLSLALGIFYCSLIDLTLFRTDKIFDWMFPKNSDDDDFQY